MPDDQFIFSSSWLPSPRFELRTLTGYSAHCNRLWFNAVVELILLCSFARTEDGKKCSCLPLHALVSLSS